MGTSSSSTPSTPLPRSSLLCCHIRMRAQHRDCSTLRHSQLVVAVGRDVSHPRQCLVSALFDDFEITYLNAADCEVRYFELDPDGGLP
mmetsp:Transcript_971/g.2808  ORF Transcript_971/g.2808 Transcript_971/m.2808 type:complete len:88 (-) Transcript_971:1469-1732(-)